MSKRMDDTRFRKVARAAPQDADVEALFEEAVRARNVELSAEADWRRVDSALRLLRSKCRPWSSRTDALGVAAQGLLVVVDEALTITRSHLP